MSLDIITINLNNAEGLYRTFESLSMQTLKPSKVILIDGLSHDNSVSVANRFKHCLNIVVSSEEDTGLYNAMNKGISKLSSPYALFLNSGDELGHSKALEIATYHIQNSKPFSIYMFSSYRKTNSILYYSPVGPLESLNYGMITTHQSIIYDSSLLAYYPYPEQYKIAADYCQICQIFKERPTTIKLSRYPLSIFYEDGISSSLISLKQALFEQALIHRCVLNSSLSSIVLVTLLKFGKSIVKLAISKSPFLFRLVFM